MMSHGFLSKVESYRYCPMKYILLILLSLSSFANAATIQVIGPCSEIPLLNTSVNIDTEESVGQFTLKAFDQLSIPYKGDDVAITSIFNSPSGSDAFEIISKTEMRAYGWCYTYNGIEPNVYPNEVPMAKNTDTVVWFYGFAHYKDGEWVSMCEKSWKTISDFICKKDVD